MPLGIYISVPFCRTKCSYCNFASDVFSRSIFERYVERLAADMARAAETAIRMGGRFERAVDSVYLGGGTPSLLEPGQLERILEGVRGNFEVRPDAEITAECAPGTLKPEIIEALVRCGVDRISLGVQSFVDEEARAVARLHTRQIVLDDIERLRNAGISNINIDLIAGLPHQTSKSWDVSLNEAIATGVPHVSVYMLEIDEDSRLGRELIAGGTKYHAHFVPDEDLTADLYTRACERLDDAGVRQYEISNFARPGFPSKHNLKYWTRQPYMGFGVDAHSMLEAETDPYVSLRAHEIAGGAGGSRPCAVTAADLESVRFSTSDSLEQYLKVAALQRIPVSLYQAREEAFFLGLRLNEGVDLEKLALRLGLPAEMRAVISELLADALITKADTRIALTPRGRLLSNEVFARFIAPSETVSHHGGAETRS
ncbi:MAG TPA: radical SAM family heme chaperone HemW [Terriglobales bacterium]|nr:radical SAM family heme chaperone HemW [Terriglobales bacterium]